MRLITLAQKNHYSVDKLELPIGQRIKAEGHMAPKMHAAVVEQFRKP
jgi:hypothetical protein